MTRSAHWESLSFARRANSSRPLLTPPSAQFPPHTYAPLPCILPLASRRAPPRGVATMRASSLFGALFPHTTQVLTGTCLVFAIILSAFLTGFGFSSGIFGLVCLVTPPILPCRQATSKTGNVFGEANPTWLRGSCSPHRPNIFRQIAK